MTQSLAPNGPGALPESYEADIVEARDCIRLWAGFLREMFHQYAEQYRELNQIAYNQYANNSNYYNHIIELLDGDTPVGRVMRKLRQEKQVRYTPPRLDYLLDITCDGGEQRG